MSLWDRGQVEIFSVKFFFPLKKKKSGRAGPIGTCADPETPTSGGLIDIYRAYKTPTILVPGSGACPYGAGVKFKKCTFSKMHFFRKNST